MDVYKDMQDDYQITVNGKTYTAENIKKSWNFHRNIAEIVEKVVGFNAPHSFTRGKYILQIQQRGSGLFRQNDYLYQRCRRQCDPEEGRKLAERFSYQHMTSELPVSDSSVIFKREGLDGPLCSKVMHAAASVMKRKKSI